MNKAPKYEKEKCHCCSQSITYCLPVDRGSVDTLKAISVAIRKKGKNKIHPRNEMEVQKGQLTYQEMVSEGVITSNHVGNLSRPRFHGLIARIKGEKGSYCLTRKGAAFLRGSEIPKYAIISKVEKHNIGYYLEDSERITINNFAPDGQEYWEGIKYDVYAPGGMIMESGQNQML